MFVIYTNFHKNVSNDSLVNTKKLQDKTDFLTFANLLYEEMTNTKYMWEPYRNFRSLLTTSRIRHVVTINRGEIIGRWADLQQYDFPRQGLWQKISQLRVGVGIQEA